MSVPVGTTPSGPAILCAVILVSPASTGLSNLEAAMSCIDVSPAYGDSAGIRASILVLVPCSISCLPNCIKC